MEVKTRKEAIQWLVSSGNAEEAMKRTMDFVKDFGGNRIDFTSKVIELSQKAHNIVAAQSSNQEGRAEVQLGILKLIDEVEMTFDEAHSPRRAAEPVIILRGVGKEFKSNKFSLKPVNATFRRGEITGIVGPNANGKSTLMKIAVGELYADSGKIDFPFFEKITPKPTWENLKHLIAYVPQELPEWRGKLKNNLRYEAALHGFMGDENELEVNYIIERLGLSRYKDANWSQLSGGYKLRFALAKALVWKPSVLVLDEPLANLDVNAQTLVLNDLKALAHSYMHPICILISSQHIHEIEVMADNIIMLEDGVVKYMGKRQDFGSDNDFNIYEFACTVAPADLTRLVSTISGAELRSHGYFYTLKTTRDVSSQDVLHLIAQQTGNIEYFRDISHSVKQFFLKAY